MGKFSLMSTSLLIYLSQVIKHVMIDNFYYNQCNFNSSGFALII